MPTTSRQNEGALGSALALLVVVGFLALAAHLSDAGPIETIIVDPASDAPAPVIAHPDAEPAEQGPRLAGRLLSRG